MSNDYNVTNCPIGIHIIGCNTILAFVEDHFKDSITEINVNEARFSNDVISCLRQILVNSVTVETFLKVLQCLRTALIYF